jgi:hypothetical protein
MLSTIVDNDVRGAIDEAMKDSAVSYTLGFYPDRKLDRVNPLKIEIKRKGLEAGYSNAFSGIATSYHGAWVDDALASPLATPPRFRSASDCKNKAMAGACLSRSIQPKLRWITGKAGWGLQAADLSRRNRPGNHQERN